MEQKISRKRYWLISAILTVTIIANLFVWKSVVMGLAFGLAYLAFFSLVAGSALITRKAWQPILGLVPLLAIISLTGASAIYFYRFNDYFFAGLLLAIPALLFLPYYQGQAGQKLSLRQTARKYLERFTQRQESKINFALAVSYIFIAIFCFIFLIQGITLSSIQSPWQTVSRQFFLFYFAGSATLLLYLFNATRTKLPLALISAHYLLSLAVALIVYGVGYGFDQFIHQATEKIILATGTISPKPLYYLGQYAIVLFLTKLTAADPALIDRFLVPVLTALTLPTTIFYVFSHWLRKNYALVIALSWLVIPYNFFIMTAPQNLANLFFIITILLSLLYFRNQIKIEVLYLLALATAAIHPIAGVPLIIVVFLFHLFKKFYPSYSRHPGMFVSAALAFAVAMPLAFLANGSSIITAWPKITLSASQWLAWVDKYDLPLNLVYLLEGNKIIAGAMLILLGVAYLHNHKLVRNNAAYFVAALVIFLNFVITKYFIVFPGIINTDQPEFVGRLANLTFYVLLPFFFLGLYWLIKKLWQKDWLTKAFVIAGLAGALNASLYLSYPHLDQYAPAKFFSLGLADLKAVNFIEKTADPNHIVLANQMVGAAAIKTVGFKKYVSGQFFYSMPIGSPRTFYDYYLEMIAGDNHAETIAKAMNEAEVEEVYFVVNKYWNGSDKIIAKANLSADAIYTVDQGEVVIFKYKK